MLEQAAEWLEHQRQMNLAVPVEYLRKGGEILRVNATSGKTLFRAENEYGVTIRTESRDFLIAASALPFDPVRGDRIRAQGREYEVLAPNGEPVWRWCGTYHWTRRVHTKEMGAV
ncbi:MAG: hypothetical protein ACI4RV_05090 [Eubacteriales bacterium]